MIIDGIEYEDEPSYIDAKTGKPVYYALGVAGLLQGDISCTLEEINISQELDKLTHLDRAKLGAEKWNLWVRWGEFTQKRWCHYEEFSDCIKVCPKGLVRADFMSITIGALPKSSAPRDFIKIEAKYWFDGFVFPSDVNVVGLLFSGIAQFRRTFFMGDANFTSLILREGIQFAGAFFSYHTSIFNVIAARDIKFMNAELRYHLAMNECNLDGNIWFSNTKIHDDVYINQLKAEVVTFDNFDCVGLLSISGAEITGSMYIRNSMLKNTLSFSEVKLSGQFDIRNVTFAGQAKLENSSFQGRILSTGVIFMSAVSWADCEVFTVANFNESQFLGGTNFSASKFHKQVEFEHVWFGKNENTPKPVQYEDWEESLRSRYDAIKLTSDSMTVPDFRGAVFDVAPNLGYTNVPEIPAPKWVWAWIKRKLMRRLLSRFWQQGVPDPNDMPPYAIKDGAAAAKLRVLGELAARGHHHLAEKRFFRAELLARRGWETKNAYEVAMINAFELFSKCGLSFWRPMIALGILIGLSASFYAWKINWFLVGENGVFELASYSFANSLPLLGYISDSYSVSVDVLFGGIEKVPGAVRVWAFAQNVVSAILIFFGLLAIRNYFKLG